MSSPSKSSGRDAAPGESLWRVLVVCKGNVCRSPLAEAVIKALSRGAIEARSRGTRSWHNGGPANSAAVRVAAERGYDLSRHVAYQVSQADIAWANEILAVDRETLEWLVAQMGPAPDRIRLYMPDGTDVPDPYEQSDEVFRASLRRIEDGARQYLAALNEQPDGFRNV